MPLPLLLLKTAATKVIGKHLDFLVPMALVSVLIGGSCWYVKTIKADRETAQAEVKVLKANMVTATGVIDSQKTTIHELVEIRKVDAASMKLLAENNQVLATKFDNRRTARNELESKNVDVKKYLDEPVPADLRGLLNRANSKYLGGNKNPSAPAPVAVAGRPPGPGH